ncbi:unnamed protein product [Caenorhabditis auriculariae]|uniref:Transporter n=1 Tax=Caenorhabditis auriculariae TaxID=2777116 RepID=A0A8S1HTF5_9PELO|nr:unnamed protein product [Caenorhabditis auriculariae]
MSISSSQAVGPTGRESKLGQRKEKEVPIDPSLYPPFIKQLDAKLPDYVREGDIEYPFEETNGVGDENRIRGNWSNKADYLLATIGFTAGVGSFWKFPFLVYNHGGAAFLVPYLVMLLVAALPMFFMEMVLGQFFLVSRHLCVESRAAFFKGVGFAQVVLSGFFAVFLNVISAWTLFYLINSFSFSLPWSNCANSWSGANCTLGTRIACTQENGTLLVNGSCVVQHDNLTIVLPIHDQNSIPSLRYFHNDMLMLSNGVDDFGTLNWYLGICVLIAWVAVFLFWGEAAVQAFYSVSCCTGGLVTISSYNRFHNNVFKDIWLVIAVDVIVSLIGCVLTFSAIGFTCFEFSIALDKFRIRDGFHLVFVFLAEALAGVPVAPLYACMFFIMVLLVVHSTQMFVVDAIVSSLCDEFPERLRRNRRHVLTTVCAVFILLSIPFCLSAGLYWMELLAHFVLTWPLVVVAFLECMAISWVYGVDNLLDNVKWITGSYPPCYMFWKILWKFICPMVFLSILSFLWLEWHAIAYESYVFPYWSVILGWVVGAIPLIFVPIVGIWEFCTAKGNMSQKWQNVLNPDDAWGPALAIHRAEQFPLQIPEARRLLLPPEVELPGSGPNEDELDPHGFISAGAEDGTSRSIANTVNSLPKFERETAI